MCRPAFKAFTGASGSSLQKHKNAVDEGRLVPYVDGRITNGKAPSIDDDVNSFFAYLYEYVAEPLADTDDRDELRRSKDTIRGRCCSPTTQVLCPWFSGRLRRCFRETFRITFRPRPNHDRSEP